MLVKIGEVAKHFGVTTQAIRDWTTKGKLKCTTTPTGTRLYDLDDIFADKEDSRIVIFYCRVSSERQIKELERQVAKARELFPEAEIISDIGSGLDYKRKGFRQLIQRAMQGKLHEVKVFNKDRLCRFGVEIVESIFSNYNIQLSVHEVGDFSTREQEYAEDLLAATRYLSSATRGGKGSSSDEIEDLQTGEE